jgi:hypothetical protein
MDDGETKKHRGRVQAQGGGLEESENWAQDEPLTKASGLSLLDKLWEKLSKRDQKLRASQFENARRFIENVDGGLDAPLGKSFLNRKKRGIRVDIEILAGTAFTLVLCLAYYFLT